MPYNIIPIVCARRACTAHLLDVNCSSTATMPSRRVTDNVMRTDLCKYYFTCGPNSNGGVLHNHRALYFIVRAKVHDYRVSIDYTIIVITTGIVPHT